MTSPLNITHLKIVRYLLRFFNILNMNNISEKLYEYIKNEYYIINEKKIN